MPRNLAAYLVDIQAAIADVYSYTKGKTFSHYSEDSLLRAGVERKLLIIGEVMAQMRYHFPDSAGRIQDAQQIIDFRNLLVHRYHVVDDTIVWGVIEGSLHSFASAIDAWAKDVSPIQGPGSP